MHEDAYKTAYEKACQHAEINTGCAHVGCCLLVNGKMVHVAYNNRTTHAEMAVLRAYSLLFSRAWFVLFIVSVMRKLLFSHLVLDILIVRVRKDKTVGLAKPCVDCLSILQRMNIRHVYYTDTHGKLGKRIENRMS